MYLLGDLSIANFAQAVGVLPPQRKKRVKRLLGEAGTIAGNTLGTASTASVLGLFRPKTPSLSIKAALVGAGIGSAIGINQVRRQRMAAARIRKPR